MIRTALRCVRIESACSFSAKPYRETCFLRTKSTWISDARGYTEAVCHSGLSTTSSSSSSSLSTHSYFLKRRIKQSERIFNHRFIVDTRHNNSSVQILNSNDFERMSTETLESLSEYFDELIESAAHLKDADVSCGDGVLTIKFGDEYGTYVINRQTPNLQLWLSSPTSGPKRYDFVNGNWIYKHDGKALHELLNEEIPAIVKCPVNFDKCTFCTKEK